MSESNEEQDVIDVDATVKLPRNFIPVRSVAEGRRKFPGEKIYRYLGRVPGWQIIAVALSVEMVNE